ncbi:hypothetical protein OC835_002902 [Tilletia horrida]|uniref:PIG-U-domain-containing protein n=1 Tax=Tilletia horrida TaxID=155126 RepID=A0AAN6GH03_9BASI|nr:hypothetical protein OC835_002902 [Tilletia horrida]KAK0538948.1 hypothetical protein OC842_001145 [Tilletia horrida]
MAAAAAAVGGKASPATRSPVPLLALLGAGTALRLFLFLHAPDLVAALTARPETSTPISSFTALREAVHLQALSHSQGHGGRIAVSTVVHHSPLVIASLGKVLRLRRWELASALVWSFFDAASAWALYQAVLLKARTKTREEKDAVEEEDEDAAHSRGRTVAALFLANPYTIASCLARSTTSLSTSLTLLAVSQALAGNAFLSTTVLSLAAHTSLWPVLQLPPLLLLARRQTKLLSGGRGGGGALVRAILGAVVGLGGGTYLAWQLQGQSWDWVYSSWGSIILLTDLTPNIGMWWYFIMEMFDHFRDFFLLTLNVHVLSYVAPFTVKYRDDPLFAMTALAGILATFQSYPTVADTALFLGLLTLHHEIFPYFRHPLVTVLLFTYSSLLLPTFHSLWLGPGARSGSGNANFFYAITLVWGLGGAAAVLDACWAWGRAQWERERRRRGPGAAAVALAARVDGAGAVEGKKPATRRVVVQL